MGLASLLGLSKHPGLVTGVTGGTGCSGAGSGGPARARRVAGATTARSGGPWSPSPPGRSRRSAGGAGGLFTGNLWLWPCLRHRIAGTSRFRSGRQRAEAASFPLPLPAQPRKPPAPWHCPVGSPRDTPARDPAPTTLPMAPGSPHPTPWAEARLRPSVSK